MRSVASGQGSRLAAAAAILLVLGVPALADTQDQGSVSAVWAPKELRFVYMGFTSHYSCDGLRDTMRRVLLQLGARKDMQLTETPCTNLSRPSHFPGVYMKINVLQPADSQSDAQPVPAHWQSVDISRISGTSDPLQDAGQCELVEQIKQSVLPLFNARNVRYSSTCVPHQLTVGGTTLKAEVLIADQPDKAPAGK